MVRLANAGPWGLLLTSAVVRRCRDSLPCASPGPDAQSVVCFPSGSAARQLDDPPSMPRDRGSTDFRHIGVRRRSFNHTLGERSVGLEYPVTKRRSDGAHRGAVQVDTRRRCRSGRLRRGPTPGAGRRGDREVHRVVRLRRLRVRRHGPGPVFFPSADPAASLLATFAVFGVGFGMRPLGGLVFGHLGDRHGRRNTLVLVIALMAAARSSSVLPRPTRRQGCWAR